MNGAAKPGNDAGAMLSAVQGGALSWVPPLLALLLSLPILSVASSLFGPSGEAFQQMAGTALPRFLANTLFLVLFVGLGVAGLGAGLAWLVSMYRFPGRHLFEWALVLPLAMPAYVLAYAYTDFLQFAGPLQGGLRELMGWQRGDYWFPEIRSLPSAALVLTVVLYPYVYLLCRTAFLEQSVCAIEVGRSLGLTGLRTFWRVALPLARPALAAGVALALMETLADYGTVAYFGIDTFVTGIYRAWYSYGEPSTAARLSTFLLLCVLLVLAIERLGRGKARYHHTSGRYRRLPEERLTGWRAALAVAVCGLPLALGFLLPTVLLLHHAWNSGDPGFARRYLLFAANSAVLGLVAAGLAVALALLLAYAQRMSPLPQVRLGNRLVALGYAVPGAVVAIGVLIPFAAFDNWLDGWLRACCGVSSGLLLTGGIAALVFAYLVRFLGIALQATEASLGKIKPTVDAAARSLGARPARLLLRVHAPLMAGGLMTAGLMVFVDVVKELPATLLLRPFDFDTLAVQTFNLARDERLAEASVTALAIVSLGLLPVYVFCRAIARSRPGHRAAG